MTKAQSKQRRQRIAQAQKAMRRAHERAKVRFPNVSKDLKAMAKVTAKVLNFRVGTLRRAG